MQIDLSKITESIQRGDNAAAIKGLIAMDFDNDDWNRKASAFSARHHSVLKKYNENHIPITEFNMENARITSGLLLLISEIENQDTATRSVIPDSITLDENKINDTIDIKKVERNEFKKYGFLCIFIGAIIVSLGLIPDFISNNDLSKILNFGGFLIVLISLYPFHLMVGEKKDMVNLKQLINILPLDYEKALETYYKICFKK